MRALVVANGKIESPDFVRLEVSPDDWVVCADGGAHNALALGLRPRVVIGDADSVAPQLRDELKCAGTRFVTYPVQKDETDAELALRYCVQHGATSVLFLGALGGRLDHALANLLLLASPELSAAPIFIVDGDVTIRLCRDRCQIEGCPGDIVTLLPIGGDAVGVVTQGLEYPLRAETLTFGLARGVSNVMCEERASVSVESGYLLLYHQRIYVGKGEG